MDRKLELKDIAGNFPYGLCVKHYEDENYTIQKITGLDDDCITFNNARESYFNEYEDDPIVIPILRPFSDLYKTIIHNGKNIIPILELAKMRIKNLKWRLKRIGVQDAPYYCAKAKLKNTTIEFYFYNGVFDIIRRNDDCVVTVDYQYELFDYLNELKIDYRGLIDAGLAVSVYDLEVNPYK